MEGLYIIGDLLIIVGSILLMLWVSTKFLFPLGNQEDSDKSPWTYEDFRKKLFRFYPLWLFMILYHGLVILFIYLISHDEEDVTDWFAWIVSSLIIIGGNIIIFWLKLNTKKKECKPVKEEN